MNFLKNHLKPHITEVITHIGIASFPNINLHQHCSQLKQWAYNAPILSINAQKGKLSMAQNIKRLQHGVPPSAVNSTPMHFIHRDYTCY